MHDPQEMIQVNWEMAMLIYFQCIMQETTIK